MTADPEKTNILIVDDLAENRIAYETVLEPLEQRVYAARSGEEALKLVLQHDFSVILLDVNMPGLDGFETAAMIRGRKRSSHTPLMFITAYTDEIRTAEGYAHGAVDYILTPVVPEILRAKVQVFVDLFLMRKRTERQAAERAERAAADELARRAAFLAESSRVLSESLDLDQTMAEVARLAVPTLCEACIVCAPGKDGRTDRGKWAWLGAGEGSIVHGDLGHLRIPSQIEKSIRLALATDKREYLPKLDQPIVVAEQHADATDAPFPVQARPVFHMLEAMTLPVSGRGQVQAVMVLGFGSSGRRLELPDLLLAENFAERASMAMQNSMLLASIRDESRRKDEFLAMLAHELRNPLGPIRNAVQLLHMMGPGDPQLREARDIVDRQVSHMSRLIDDLLDISRLSRGKILLRKEVIDAVKLIRATAEDYRSIFEASGLDLALELPPGELHVRADSTRLAQAVGNLLHNAHKFTPPGGTVTVQMQADMDNEFVAIHVRDTGIGIDAVMLPRVFDVFCQADVGLDRKSGGLGLGLALVRGLVEMHGGIVSAASEGPDRGTEFMIRLPLTSALCRSPDVEDPDALDGRVSEANRHRILLIEDNRDAALVTERLLSMAGHEVRVAGTGAAGLSVMREFRPLVIFCDIGLPDGMTGYDVARAIREDSEMSQVFIIALTGYGRDEDQRKAHEAGFDLHLTKPVDYQTLRRTLAALPARV